MENIREIRNFDENPTHKTHLEPRREKKIGWGKVFIIGFLVFLLIFIGIAIWRLEIPQQLGIIERFNSNNNFLDLSSATWAGSSLLVENYSSGNSADANIEGVEWRGQTFSHENDFDIKVISLMLSDTGDPSTNLTVGIRATDANNKPTGADLVSISMNLTMIEGNNNWYNFTFPTAYSLSANTNYSIVIRDPSSAGIKFANWEFDSASPTYTKGNYVFSGDSGSTWGINDGRDFLFEIYQEAGTISLNSPEDNYLSPTSSVDFNATAVVVGATLVNMSLWHNGTGTWEINQTTDVTGTTNTTIFTTTIEEATPTLWNVQACDSDGDCGFGGANRTVNVDTIYPTIDVEAPSDVINYGSVGSSETLNVTFTDVNLNTCWYDYNGTNVTIGGCQSGIKNSTTFTLEANNFNMTLYSNDSVNNLNSSFISWGYSFFEDSSSANTEINETATQTINLNITTTQTIVNINSILTYDNTNYTAVSDCSGSSCEISAQFDTPLVSSGESENKTYFWTLNLYNGTGSNTLTTTSYNQSVDRIHLEKCNATYTTNALNFTNWDEENLSRISSYDVDATFQYYYGTGDVKRITSVSENSLDELDMCLQPIESNMFLDGQIEYGNNLTLYDNRNYYFEGHIINDTLEHINLYSLKKSSSTSFILAVEDQETSAVPDALIYVQRYYPGENVYRTVQIARTDDNGKSTGFYKTETVDYKHLIYLNEVLELETDKGKIIPETTPYTLTFRIGGGLDTPTDDFTDLPGGVATSLTFNQSSNMTTYTWTDSDGSTSLGRLLIYQIKADEGNVLISNHSINFPSGTLTFNATGYNGSFVAKGYIKPDSSSSELFTNSISFVVGEEAKDLFGFTGIIVGWFIILTATLAFIWNPTAMVVVHNVATIFVWMIGLISFGYLYIFAMIAVSVIAIIMLKT